MESEEKQVKKRVRNPTGKGGFGDHPELIRPGPGRGHKRKLDAQGDCVLADMQTAYTTREADGESPGVKSMRKLLSENMEKFLTLYAKLGGKAMSEPDPDGATAPAGVKEEKVDELCERLLAEWEAEDARV